MSNDFWRLSATELARAYREDGVSPVAVLASIGERGAAVNRLLNALVTVDPTVHAQAEESERRLRAGSPRSPLEGVPVATLGEYLSAFQETKPGAIVTLTILRGSEKTKVKVTLGERPTPQG